jgi:hypothetical protein
MRSPFWAMVVLLPILAIAQVAAPTNLSAQVNTFSSMTQFAGVPSGSCTNGTFALDQATGGVYVCNGGVWVPSGTMVAWKKMGTVMTGDGVAGLSTVQEPCMFKQANPVVITTDLPTGATVLGAFVTTGPWASLVTRYYESADNGGQHEM